MTLEKLHHLPCYLCYYCYFCCKSNDDNFFEEEEDSNNEHSNKVSTKEKIKIYKNVKSDTSSNTKTYYQQVNRNKNSNEIYNEESSLFILCINGVKNILKILYYFILYITMMIIFLLVILFMFYNFTTV